jgi:DNA-nicking Smr family endonuclease
MDEEAVTVPINGVLDLHTFLPRELGELVPAYLTASREQGIYEIRIIHGKGTGNLRRSVHAILARLDYVESYRPADETRGGWGATLVQLKRDGNHLSP